MYQNYNNKIIKLANAVASLANFPGSIETLHFVFPEQNQDNSDIIPNIKYEFFIPVNVKNEMD